MTSTPTLPAVPTVIGSGTCACGQLPSAHFAIPVPIITNIDDDERVGGQGECDARLAHAAQVHDRQQQDEPRRER